MHPIERKVTERAYQSPKMARSAIAKSTIGRADKKRLLGLIDQWEAEGLSTRRAAPSSDSHPVIGAMPAEAVVPPVLATNGSRPLRFETIRHAHGILSELARDKHVELTALIDEIQAYELSIRKEVQRRELEGSLEEPS